MTVDIDSERARDSAPAVVTARSGGRRRPRRRWGDRLLFAWTWLIIIWLALPIAVMIMFSFNNPHGRFNFTWVGFTLKWYGPHLLDYPSLTTAMENSLLVAFAATVGSVVLGTLVGLALGKYRFRGLGTANLVQFARSPRRTSCWRRRCWRSSSRCACRSGCRRSSWRTSCSACRSWR